MHFSVGQNWNIHLSSDISQPFGYLWHDVVDRPPRVRDWYIIEKAFLPAAPLKHCQTNSGCGVGQFCGDVVNRSEDEKYSALCSTNKAKCKVHKDCFGGTCKEDVDGSPYWDEDHKFCYTMPTMPARHPKHQFLIRASEANFHLCDSDQECRDWKNQPGVCNRDIRDDPFKGLKWAGYVPDPAPSNTGKRKLFSGVCVQATPISFTFSLIYDTNPDDKYLAIGTKTTTLRENFKKCKKNADCDQGQYCGNILSFSEKSGLDTQYTFCFVVPDVVNPPTLDNKYSVPPNVLNLVPCDNKYDCSAGKAYGSYCHHVKNWTYVGFDWLGAKKLYKGLCTEGDSYMKQCTLGGELLRYERCGYQPQYYFAKCNGGLDKIGDPENKLDAWCDTEIERCCRDPKIGLCPDKQTKLFNEPECSGYNASIPDSGICESQKGAICKFGHCCPNVTINSIGNVIRGTHSYTTWLFCEPGVRPLKYPAAYCQPESRRVVVFGQLSFENEQLTRWPEESPKQCEKDSDCTDDGVAICIFQDYPYCPNAPKSCVTHSDCDGTGGICVNNVQGFCFYNPVRHIPVKFPNQKDKWWPYILLLSILIIGIPAALYLGFRADKRNQEGLESESPNAQTPTKKSETKSSIGTPTQSPING